MRKSLILFFIALGLGAFFLLRYFDEGSLADPSVDSDFFAHDNYYLPTGGIGELHDQGGFFLSYREDKEQPEWVAYTLGRKELNLPKSKRPKDFHYDPDIRTKSAVDNDYRGSGYSRGHMVPAADMSWNQDYLHKTFLFSNICPQEIPFNGGVWRELEECTRDWARKFYRLHIVSGPVFERGAREIGRNRVDVPKGFFKVILDLEEPEQKAIAFYIPHEVQTAELSTFAVSIDEVEEMTGLDFFADLLTDQKETRLESNYNIASWPISYDRYQQRINHWNKR